jgi:hypothetical protein
VSDDPRDTSELPVVAVDAAGVELSGPVLVGRPAVAGPEAARWTAVLWGLGFSGLTGLGLTALGLLLSFVSALASVADYVMSPDESTVESFSLEAVVVACLIGWVLAAVMSAVAAWLVHEWLGSGRAVMHGLAGGVVGAVSGYAAMMLTLGVDPLGFALSWV